MKLLKIIIGVLLIAAVAFYAKNQFSKKAYIDEHNRGIEHFNKEEFGKAKEIFQALLNEVSESEEKEKLKGMIAKCLKHSLKPSLSLKEQLPIYKEMYDLDPSSLSDQEKRLLRSKKLIP